MEENEIVEVEAVTKPKKNGRKIVIIVIVAIVVVALAFGIGKAMKAVSSNMKEQMNAAMGETDDELFTVEREDVEQEITTSGTVVGVETKAYTSPVNAKVDDICVEVGQTVKKGDVLLTYDASELGDNLEKVKIQAQSERAAGNESYEQANKAAGKASEASEKAKNLKSDIKKLNKEIDKLNKKIETYEDKAKAAEQVQTPSTDEEGTQESGDTEAKAEGLTAKEEKDYKKAVSDVKKKTETLTEKQQKLAEQESIVQANEDVTVSESTKAQISATNRLSDMNINDAQESLKAAEAGITAKSSGIVASIDVYKGAYATETQTLLTVIDGDKIGVEFAIAKDDLGSITVGQKARVVISGNEYDGTVDFISRVATVDAQSATGSGTIKGRIMLDEPDDNIYIGVSAKAYIFVGKSEKTLVIPYEALCSDVDGDYVYVVNDENLIERKDVTLGLCSDAYYEVLDGVEEGDKVICNVTKDMKPGDSYVGSEAVVPGTGSGLSVSVSE